MEEEKKIVKKKKNKYIIIVFLLALIVGGSCGLYYVDTFYGEGKINTIISSLQEKTQKIQQNKQQKKIVSHYQQAEHYLLQKVKDF